MYIHSFKHWLHVTRRLRQATVVLPAKAKAKSTDVKRYYVIIYSTMLYYTVLHYNMTCYAVLQYDILQ